MEATSQPHRFNFSACWINLIAWLLCKIYFSSLRIVGAPLRHRPHQLIICSHRNGAIDGYCVLQAFPQALFPLSVQLLRNPLLRLMFAGIPVVRQKDSERYEESASKHGSMLRSACEHLRSGGTLAMFPEGSSEWGPHPLPYQPGTARIVRMLLDKGVPLEVVPLGLFYRVPDRFRSGVEILLGEPVVLPERKDAGLRAWEQEIHIALSRALDAVSVNCPDTATFEQVERLARTDADREQSYALAFKRWEQQAIQGLPDLPDGVPVPPRSPLWRLLCGLPGMALLMPVLLAGFLAGHKADARNTVTFFRMAGGFAMALPWLPVLAALFCFFPLPMLCWSLLGIVGWLMFKR